MSGLQVPVCNLCNKTFLNMQVLCGHMKNEHSETDHGRMERLTTTISSALRPESKKMTLAFYCTECGDTFKSHEDMKNHEAINHQEEVKTNTNCDKISDDLLIEENDYSDEYVMEAHPKEGPDELKNRIKFSCESEDFKEARN